MLSCLANSITELTIETFVKGVYMVFLPKRFYWNTWNFVDSMMLFQLKCHLQILPPTSVTFTRPHCVRTRFMLTLRLFACKATPSAAGELKLEEQTPCSFDALLVDIPINKTLYKFDRSSDTMQFFLLDSSSS